MISWLQAGGTDTSKIAIMSYAENLRGIHASVDIKANEMVILIPERYMLTSSVVADNPIGK